MTTTRTTEARCYAEPHTACGTCLSHIQRAAIAALVKEHGLETAEALLQTQQATIHHVAACLSYAKECATATTTKAAAQEALRTAQERHDGYAASQARDVLYRIAREEHTARCGYCEECHQPLHSMYQTRCTVCADWQGRGTL